VDYNQPTTYVQANAYMLQAVIAWVNTQKTAAGSTSKNVVLGISMGGLVARYALADMEDRNVQHDTKLMITHDTPHQGANIPPSFQAFFRQIGDLEITLPNSIGPIPIPGLGKVKITSIIDGFDIDEGQEALTDQLDMLDSDAARQMLINYVDINGNGDLFYDNSAHQTFMQDLRAQGMSGSNGYPSRWGISNVVISNGSECGGDQGYAAGSPLVSVNDKQFIPYHIALLGSLASATFSFYSKFGLFGLGLLSTRTHITTDFQLKSVPNQQVAQVYYGRLGIKRKILFLININQSITEKSLNSTASMLPYDNAAGGNTNLDQFVDDDLPIAISIAQPFFSFIPTTSSLDIGGNPSAINSTDLYSSFLNFHKQYWFETLVKFNIAGFVYVNLLFVFFGTEVFICFWYY
jgi:hypothetical protein